MSLITDPTERESSSMISKCQTVNSRPGFEPKRRLMRILPETRKAKHLRECTLKEETRGDGRASLITMIRGKD